MPPLPALAPLLAPLLASLTRPGCAACRRGDPDGQRIGWGGRLCAGCAGEIPPGLTRLEAEPSVQGGWAMAPYAGPAGALIRQAKYGRDEAALQLIAAELAARWARRAGIGVDRAVPDRIVPAPGSPWRAAWRGVDPVRVLAEAVGRRAGLPVLPALIRRGGRPQAGLPPEARRQNLRGHIHAAPAGLAGARVLLLDDVVTTGATAHACADALLGAGAREVWLLAACAAGERISG